MSNLICYTCVCVIDIIETFTDLNVRFLEKIGTQLEKKRLKNLKLISVCIQYINTSETEIEAMLTEYTF